MKFQCYIKKEEKSSCIFNLTRDKGIIYSSCFSFYYIKYYTKSYEKNLRYFVGDKHVIM